MTPAWTQRQEALLRDCIVSPDVFASMVDRLCDFVVPYTYCISRRNLRDGMHLRVR
jgi:hypothetical protein